MANPFDQFDSNPFDQFDAANVPAQKITPDIERDYAEELAIQRGTDFSRAAQNFMKDEPGYVYGQSPISWYKKNQNTGDISLAVPEVFRSAIRGTGDLQQMAETHSTQMTPDAVNATLTMLSPALSAEGTAGPRLPKPEPFNPDAAHAAISKSYGEALAKAKPFYDYMNKTAEGKTVDASDLIQPVKAMAEDIKGDPFHEARTALPRLNSFIKQLEDNPNIPLSDAVDMKKQINSNFNSKRFTQGGDTPYFHVGRLLDSKLDQAAKQYPEFGFAKTLADQNWVNNVVQPFTENTVLHKFWKPEDYYAQKSIDKGLATQLPDATRQRAAVMLSKIKDPVALDAITRTLPEEQASQFRQALGNYVTKGAGGSRLSSAGKAVSSAMHLHPLDFLQNTLDVAKGPSYEPWQQMLIKASRQPSPRLNPQYQMTLESLLGQPLPVAPLSLMPTARGKP